MSNGLIRYNVRSKFTGGSDDPNNWEYQADDNGQWLPADLALDRIASLERVAVALRDALDSIRNTLSGYHHEQLGGPGSKIGRLEPCGRDCNCSQCASRRIADAALAQAAELLEGK